MTSTTTPCITASDSPTPSPATATKGSSQGVERKIRRTRLHSQGVHIPASHSLMISNSQKQDQQHPHADSDPSKTKATNSMSNVTRRIPYARGSSPRAAPAPYPPLGPPPSCPPPPPPFTPAPGDTFNTRGEISAPRAWDAYVYGNSDHPQGGYGYRGDQSNRYNDVDDMDGPRNTSVTLTAQAKRTNAKVLKWLDGQKD